MKSHPVEMASEVATLDPTRGVESTAVTPNAGGTKVEAVADTKTPSSTSLVLAKTRSTRAVEWSENYTCGFSAN